MTIDDNNTLILLNYGTLFVSVNELKEIPKILCKSRKPILCTSSGCIFGVEQKLVDASTVSFSILVGKMKHDHVRQGIYLAQNFPHKSWKNWKQMPRMLSGLSADLRGPSAVFKASFWIKYSWIKGKSRRKVLVLPNRGENGTQNQETERVVEFNYRAPTFPPCERLPSNQTLWMNEWTRFEIAPSISKRQIARDVVLEMGLKIEIEAGWRIILRQIGFDFRSRKKGESPRRAT